MSIASFSESSMLIYVPKLRNVAPRLQNRFESAFSLYCCGNREESYTGCKNKYKNRIQSKDCCIFILAVSLLLSELGRAVCPSKRVEL